jgi:hypothetical protein
MINKIRKNEIFQLETNGSEQWENIKEKDIIVVCTSYNYQNQNGKAVLISKTWEPKNI